MTAINSFLIAMMSNSLDSEEGDSMTYKYNAPGDRYRPCAANTEGVILGARHHSTGSDAMDEWPPTISSVIRLLMTCAFIVTLASSSQAQTKQKTMSTVGISIAGPEFGAHVAKFSNANPGKSGVDYTYNRPETVTYFARKGIKLFRLPLRWERLQPSLMGALDGDELQRVRTFVSWVESNEGRVILDLHNYGRYRMTTSDGQVVECVIDERIDGRVLVSRNDFADFWRRMAVEFHDHPAIYGYGLMNEPHHMGGSDWKAISQTAVNAIRVSGDKSLLLIAGDAWSNAEHWESANGSKPWIEDPTHRIAYEAHCYFDHDSSGKHRLSFDDELERDPKLHDRGRRRVTPFIDWCARNRVEGIVGEFSAPRDVRWRQVMTPFLDAVRDADMNSISWAAGDWWGDYPLSLQPSADFLVAAPQLSWILDRQPRSPAVGSRDLKSRLGY